MRANRKRFLQPEELGRLGAALDEALAKNEVGPFAIAAMKLLIFTGARLNEILTLQWSFVDIERRKLLLPDSKTGQKSITLNDEALAVLKDIPRFPGNNYVIVGFRHATRCQLSARSDASRCRDCQHRRVDIIP